MRPAPSSADRNTRFISRSIVDAMILPERRSSSLIELIFITFDGDEGRLSQEAFLRDFAGDLPEAKAKVLHAVQQPFQKALLAGKTTQAAWRTKPSFYAVSTEDRTINPDLQRFMAKRMSARTIEVKASHVSLISQPEVIATLILEAAGQR